MSYLIGRTLVACIAGFAVSLFACGGGRAPAPSEDVTEAQAEALGADAGASCADGHKRCKGQQPQVCQAHAWVNDGACTDQACNSGACIGVCKPGEVACDQGNDVMTCQADGQWAYTSTCPSTETCVAGVCGPKCSVVDRTPCALGYKCEPTSTGNICLANGAVAVGGICAETGAGDDCKSPGVCLGYSSGPAICLDFCTTDADCKQPAAKSGATAEPANVGHCFVQATLNGASYTLCTDACNPVTKAGPSGCAAGLACAYQLDSSPPEYTNCNTVGTVAEGGDCASAQCGPGLFCVDNGTTSTCRQVCRAGKSADCTAAGDTCQNPYQLTGPMFGICCGKAGCF